ncbi:3-mercaptopyruvate sulfurtransferase [Vibrio sp. DW001]|uniref:3-mercaptopyruvate sulfurtransferase n=1 Tax=Vibrio sp. DW001 TaxID=2912315 RepID=UPI0023B044FC|nr:3-mercaptopyruvate sulfurtransferase [Vibrio sp. DW001]WED27768.1 3-mercaptopyruvate sulfurtransferase [Vibrio sp. DW001]
MSLIELSSSVVDVDWLKIHLNHPELTVIDASWFMPGIERDGRSEWQSERIPGALFFDFDTLICDLDSDLPHMMPSADYFAEQVGLLGIGNDTKIVVYDSHGLFSSPRVWWMFKAMGHNDVAVLNGGLPAWKAASAPLDSSEPIALPTCRYQAQLCSQWQINIETLNTKTHLPEMAIIDARPAERFHGQQAEPRENVRSGHIPSSKNLPFPCLVENGYLKSVSELKMMFADVCDDSQSLIFTCGSGVTACVLALAAMQCNKKKLSVYDGSWTEWGSRHDFPIE